MRTYPHTCGAARRYDETFDSYFCNEHDVWIEPTCGDAECEICSPRPPRPSMVAASPVSDGGDSSTEATG